MQLAFVTNYMVSLNAKKAALAAGYSEASAETQGWQLLHNPIVSKELRKRMKRRAKRLDLTAENVLREIARIAFSDIRAVAEIGATGVTFKTSDELHPDAAAAIQSIQSDTKVGKLGESSTTLKVKLHDKMKALDLAGKHLGLFLSGEGDDPFKKMTLEQLLALVKGQMEKKP